MNRTIASQTKHKKLFFTCLALFLLVVGTITIGQRQARAGNEVLLYLPLVYKDLPPVAQFSIDQNTLNADANECTTLRWEFSEAELVSIKYARGFSERVSAASGTATVCPSISTTYEAIVQYPNGTTEIRELFVNVVGDSCNRDPYIQQFNPTATQVNRNEIVTVTWDVRCATEVYLAVNADPQAFVNHQDAVQYRIAVSSFFQMRVLKIVNGQTVFEEPASFGITVRPDTQQEQK